MRKKHGKEKKDQESLIFVSLESQKERRKIVELKKYLNNYWKYPKFGKRHKATDARSWANHILEEKTDMHVSFKLKEKILKASAEKCCITWGNQWFGCLLFVICILRRPEESEAAGLRHRKKIYRWTSPFFFQLLFFPLLSFSPAFLFSICLSSYFLILTCGQ